MLERWFQLSENQTTARTELLAGTTTFLTMAYIIFLQPAVLSGALFDPQIKTGIDPGAVMTATCLAAALATAIMALYARYPIALAPGMGQNFFFVLSAIPAAAAAGVASPWQAAFGVVFISGVLFLFLSLIGLREAVINALSPSTKFAVSAGIGLFIAFIGLRNGGLVVNDPGTSVKLTSNLLSPDLCIFMFGLLVTGGLLARGVRGAILWGILLTAAVSIGLKEAIPYLPDSALLRESRLATQFKLADDVVSLPPSIAPTLLQMDLSAALHASLWPFILIFLFMDLFDTLGTLIGVGQQAGLLVDNKLPRASQAFVADAVGTVAGAALGTSTVTSFIESAAGVEQGGRTGLTSLTAAVLFLAALFFAPVVAMVGSYPPITAPALVIVGSLMIRSVTAIEWSDYSESIPAFLTLVGIPLTFSIADGLALGLISYPVVKLIAGRRRDVTWLMYLLALILVLYFALIRGAPSEASPSPPEKQTEPAESDAATKQVSYAGAISNSLPLLGGESSCAPSTISAMIATA